MENGEKEIIIFSVKRSPQLLFIRFTTAAIVVFLMEAINITLIRKVTPLMSNFVTAWAVTLLLSVLVAGAYGHLSYQSTRYTLTNKRLTIEEGILNKSRRSVPIERIQDISLNQQWTERLFNLGGIFIESAGELGAFRMREIGNFQTRTKQVSQVLKKFG